MFSVNLNKKLDEFHLLKHPFYIAWNKGELSLEIIRDYAEQYYHHVKAFPRYISATHSLCEDISKRKVLLENLQEEEDFENDHPKLWKKFALSLGSDEKEIETNKQENFTQDMINNFFKQARSSFAEGLGSFYTYERQVPEIAVTKIKGLKKFYGINSIEGLKFFEVHKDADILHRSECEKLLNTLNNEEKILAEKAALTTAKFMWNFLSGLAIKHKLPLQTAA